MNNVEVETHRCDIGDTGAGCSYRLLSRLARADRVYSRTRRYTRSYRRAGSHRYTRAYRHAGSYRYTRSYHHTGSYRYTRAYRHTGSYRYTRTYCHTHAYRHTGASFCDDKRLQ